MKKSLLVIIALMAVNLSLNAQNNYTLNVNIKGAENKKAVFNNDTIVLNKYGQGTFKGSLEYPQTAFFKVIYQKDYGSFVSDRYEYISILPENSTMNLSVTFDNEENKFKEDINLTGSKTNDIYESAWHYIKNEKEKLSSLSQEYKEAEKNNNKTLMKNLEDEYNEIEKNLLKYYESFLKENAQSHASLYVFRDFILKNIETQKAKEYFSLISSKLKINPLYESLNNKIEVLLRIEPGQPLIDFTSQDENGKTVKLSQFKGKIIVLNFSASWCGPCRKSDEKLIAIYNKYKPKGVVFIQVDLDFRSKEKWLEYANTLPWVNVHEENWGKSKIAKEYNVMEIPHIILIDKKGIMRNKYTQPNNLDEAIEKLLD